MLNRLGYTFLSANSGKDGVRIAREYSGEIHLAFLDMGMPDMSGPETFPLLMESRPDLKVIICSGYELDSASQALLDSGALAFLDVRPVTGLHQ